MHGGGHRALGCEEGVIRLHAVGQSAFCGLRIATLRVRIPLSPPESSTCVLHLEPLNPRTFTFENHMKSALWTRVDAPLPKRERTRRGSHPVRRRRDKPQDGSGDCGGDSSRLRFAAS
jgi:hypothetical protein